MKIMKNLFTLLLITLVYVSAGVGVKAADVIEEKPVIEVVVDQVDLSTFEITVKGGNFIENYSMVKIKNIEYNVLLKAPESVKQIYVLAMSKQSIPINLYESVAKDHPEYFDISSDESPHALDAYFENLRHELIKAERGEVGMYQQILNEIKT